MRKLFDDADTLGVPAAYMLYLGSLRFDQEEYGALRR
jgi:hypothetical protein